MLDHALDPDPKTLTLSLSLSLGLGLGLGIRCDRIPGLARAGSGLGPDACTLTLTLHCSLAAGVTCTLHSALWQQGSRNCNPAAGVTCTLHSAIRLQGSRNCNPAAGVSELQFGSMGRSNPAKMPRALSSRLNTIPANSAQLLLQCDTGGRCLCCNVILYECHLLCNECLLFCSPAMSVFDSPIL